MVISEGGRKPFWKTIGFEWPEGLSPATTTIACVVLALVLFGLAQLVTYIYGERKTDLDLLIESSIYARIATAFMATATAPLVEEVIYRGVLYRALEKAAGAAVAVPVVSLLFAGVHVWQYRNNIAVIIVITRSECRADSFPSAVRQNASCLHYPSRFQRNSVDLYCARRLYQTADALK